MLVTMSTLGIGFDESRSSTFWEDPLEALVTLLEICWPVPESKSSIPPLAYESFELLIMSNKST